MVRKSQTERMGEWENMTPYVTQDTFSTETSHIGQ